MDAASELYQGASGQEYHDKKRMLRPQALQWVMALRAEKFQPHVRETDVVLEFGVGSGWNLGQLRCSRKIGCDTSEFLRDRVTSLGIEFFPQTNAIPDATAHVVICHQTLEHVLSPASVLKELARLLRSDGRLILHVPWECEARYSRYDPAEPNHHLYSWNAQNIGNLVSVLGYKIDRVRVRKYGYDRFAANLALRLALGPRAFRLIRRTMILLRPLKEVEIIAAHPR